MKCCITSTTSEQLKIKMDNKIEVLFTRFNELSRQVSNANKLLDQIVARLDNLQIRTTNNERRLDENDNLQNSGNPGNSQVQKIQTKSSNSDTKLVSSNPDIGFSNRIDGLEKEIERLKNIVSSFILRNPDTPENEDEEDEEDEEEFADHD